MVMILAAAFWALGDGWLVLRPSWPVERALVTLTFTCISTVTLAWLLFALEFTGRRAWITRGRTLVLGVVPLVMVVLVATNEFHYWVWRYRLAGETKLSENGPAMLGFLAYVYTLFLLGVALFLQMLLRASPARRTSTLVVLAAGLVPWAADAIQFILHYPHSPRSIVPYTFLLSGPLLAWGLFRFRFLQMAPVARDRVFKSMNDGVVVLDRSGWIADLNPAASRLLSAPGSKPPAVGDRLGLPKVGEGGSDRVEVAEATFDWLVGSGDGQRILEVRRQPLRDVRGYPVGSLVFLRDATAKRAAAAEREKILADLRSACSRVRTLSGLLPICAGCKQIRDKQGNWIALGTYLRAHSEARPTAGLCPECRSTGFFPG